MQRALMTTIHLFKNHPNKKNIHFVVLPNLREALRGATDIAIDCIELINKFGEDKTETCGIKFDFSRFFQYGIPSLW